MPSNGISKHMLHTKYPNTMLLGCNSFDRSISRKSSPRISGSPQLHGIQKSYAGQWRSQQKHDRNEQKHWNKTAKMQGKCPTENECKLSTYQIYIQNCTISRIKQQNQRSNQCHSWVSWQFVNTKKAWRMMTKPSFYHAATTTTQIQPVMAFSRNLPENPWFFLKPSKWISQKSVDQSDWEWTRFFFDQSEFHRLFTCFWMLKVVKGLLLLVFTEDHFGWSSDASPFSKKEM